MNIFITGATGFIGNAFLRVLLTRILPEDRVYALTRSLKLFPDGRVAQLAGSLETINKFENEILSSDCFFHIAAESGLEGKKNYEGSITAATRDIVNILKKGKSLKKFVYISSVAAVGRSKDDDCSKPLSAGSKPQPAIDYGLAKLAAENCVAESGLPYVIIRPSFVYGKNMRAESHINTFVSMAYHKSPFIYFDYPGRISLIHVDDLALALVNCIYGDAPAGRTYFAETETLTVGDTFKIIYQKIHNRSLEQIVLPRIDRLLSRIHPLLPAKIAILFLNYFWAQDERFRQELLKGMNFKRISNYIDDVISTNYDIVHNAKVLRMAP